eukprot:1140476-Heterocapsa_arctica.AAC.1
MPHIPQMRTLTVPRGRRLLVSKRDARHYFHVLRNGPKWRQWLALPPMMQRGLKKYPVQRAWPMVFVRV